jgi:hypothetical protein
MNRSMVMPNLPSGWSQAASDALKWMAEQALEDARENPGEWINPTSLDSQVRYNPRTRSIEIYGRMDVDQPAGFVVYHPDSAFYEKDMLFRCWAEDLRDDEHWERNRDYVERLNLQAEIGWRTRW